MFAALMAIGANITWAPFFTSRRRASFTSAFFCYISRTLLGSRMGSISMIVYVLIGIAGAPVFAQFKAGIRYFIWKHRRLFAFYIVAAFITGKIMEMRGKPTFSSFLISSLVGIAVIYLIGTTYMYVAVNYYLKLCNDMQPLGRLCRFAVKDLIFTVLGLCLLREFYKAPTIFFVFVKYAIK